MRKVYLFLEVVLFMGNSMSGFIIVGHRGMSDGVTENSIEAFEKAIDQGAQMLEFDVWQCASGELVVFHDPTLEALGDERSIKSLTFSELQNFSLSNGETIPTLVQVIDTVNRRAQLDIEVKDPDAFVAVGECVATYLEEGWKRDDFLVTSYDHFSLKEFIAQFPAIPAGAISCAALLHYDTYLENLGVDYAIVDYLRLTPAFYEALKRWGKRIIVYTVNNKQALQKLAKLAIYGIATDYPGYINETLFESG